MHLSLHRAGFLLTKYISLILAETLNVGSIKQLNNSFCKTIYHKSLKKPAVGPTTEVMVKLQGEGTAEIGKL